MSAAVREVYSRKACWFSSSPQRYPCCRCFNCPQSSPVGRTLLTQDPPPPPFDFAVVLSDQRARMEQTNGIYGNCQGQRICSQCMLSIEIIATTWRWDSSSHSPTGQLSVTHTRVHTHVLNLLTIVFVHRKRRKTTVHITL